LIDAEFIEKWINREEHNTPDERWRPESELAAMIDNAPTVDAVEVVHGRWKFDADGDPYCSVCREYAGLLRIESGITALIVVRRWTKMKR